MKVDNINPYVSIVCITYNHIDFIENAIRGFLNQDVNYKIEILIADDASTDGTHEIINKYVNKYPEKIKFFRNIENKGGKLNWNNLIGKAKGKYIALCDGDDFWIDINKLQSQTDILDKKLDYDLVFTDFNMIGKNSIIKSVFRNKILPVVTDFNSILISKPYLAPQSWVFRSEYKEKILRYNDPKNNFVDGTFPLLLEVSRCSKIFYLQKTTLNYRKHEGSITGTKDLNKIKNFMIGIFEIQKFYCKEYKAPSKILDLISNNFYNSIIPYAIATNDKELISTLKNKSFTKCYLKKLIISHGNNFLVRIVVFLLIKIRKNLFYKTL